MSDLAVELSAVSRAYQEAGRLHPVLQGIDAAFPRGRFIAIRGRSGSGKSTLLNLLAGIDLPDTGEIAINGQVINRMSERERTLFRRRHIGFVFQFFNLIPTLTVAENIRFPLELNGIKGAAATARVSALLERFSLADRLDSFPDQLSGGEQQRVAVARAAVHTPALILADEPSGNLDLETGQQVLGLLRSLPGDSGVCVICATHSNEVTALADEIWQIEQGRLVRR